MPLAPTLLLLLSTVAAPDCAPAPAVIARADSLLARREREAVRRLLPCLGAGAVAEGSAPALLTWGRAERAAGEPAVALVAFRRYLAAGGVRGLGRVELARLELPADEEAGAARYYEGATDDDPRSVHEYRLDLAYIATPDELDAFDRQRGDARARWLEGFWTREGGRSLLTPRARLAEHYRRLATARREHAWTPDARILGDSALAVARSREFDDLGLVIVRYGAPTRFEAEWERAAGGCLAYTAMPQDTRCSVAGAALYTLPEGPRLFLFRACARPINTREFVRAPCTRAQPNWHVVGGPQEVFIPAPLLHPWAPSLDTDDPITRLVLRLGKHLPAEYGSAFDGVPNPMGGGSGQDPRSTARSGTASALEGYVEQKTRTAQALTERSAEPRYDAALPSRVEALLLGREARGMHLHLLYGLPAKHLTPERLADGWRYTYRFRASAMDSSGAVLALVDRTATRRAAARLADDDFIVGRETLVVPAGTVVLRTAVEAGAGRGTALPAVTMTVPAATDEAVVLSDLVLGRRDALQPWVRAGQDTVWFNPSALFRRTAPLDIAFEVYGLRAGEAYRVSVELEQRRKTVFASWKPVLRFDADETARGGTVGGARELDLTRFEPGRYRVTLRVAARGGERVRQREFVLGD